MDSVVLLAMAFSAGFLCGYVLRAQISLKRRRLARQNDLMWTPMR